MPADAPDDYTRKYRKQNATYWPRTGTDPTGDPTYGPPEDIKVRWSDFAEEMIDNNGDRTVSRSSVLVGFDIDPANMPVLRLGTVASLPGGYDIPQDYPGAYEVRQFRKVPTANARRFYREALL